MGLPDGVAPAVDHDYMPDLRLPPKRINFS